MAYAHTNELPERFEYLAELASDLLDQITQDYYQYHKIDDDPFKLRATRFKRAVLKQIEYMVEQHVTSTEALKAAPLTTTQTIGKTSVSKSYSAKYSASGDGPIPSIISDDAVAALSGTGLLFRGVMHRD